MCLERQAHVVESDGLAFGAEHPRDAEAPDVGVEHADLVPVGSERGRKVDRDRRLADAALAGGDRDDRGARRERDLGRSLGVRPTERADERLPLLRRHRRQADLHPLDAQQRLHRSGNLLRDPVAEGAAFDREQDVHAHVAAVDRDALQHADVLDRLADLGVEHLPERLADLCFAGHGLSLRAAVGFPSAGSRAGRD